MPADRRPMTTAMLHAAMIALAGTLKGVVDREVSRATDAEDERVMVCRNCRMLVGSPHAGDRAGCVPEEDRLSVLGMDLLVLPGASNLVEATTPADLHPLQRRVLARMIRLDRERRFDDADLDGGA